MEMFYVARVNGKLVKGNKKEMELCFGDEIFWEQAVFPKGYDAPITKEEYEDEFDEEMPELPNILEALETIEDVDGNPIGYYDCWGHAFSLDEEYNSENVIYEDDDEDKLFFVYDYEGTPCIGKKDAIKSRVGDWEDDSSDYNPDCLSFGPFSTGYTMEEYEEALEKKAHLFYDVDSDTAEFLSHDEIKARLGFDPYDDSDEAEESHYAAIPLEDVELVFQKTREHINPYDDIFQDMPAGVAETYNTGW